MNVRGLGALAAALAWVAALRWFPEGLPYRPGWLDALPALPLLLAALAAGGAWLWRSAALAPERPLSREERRALLLAVGLALLVRLPMAWQGGAGFLTPDGALSGTVALHVHDGGRHHVFVPHVPYSGSMKSHLAAALMALVDPVRAFALASLAFVPLFVAGAFLLARAAVPAAPLPAALGAGLWAAFAPAFVTRYTLSNDGNYVEVLGLGAIALWACAQSLGDRADAARWGAIGALLGLALWCHILAVIPLAACGLALLAWAPARRWPAAGGALVAGWATGYAPGVLWNLANAGLSFRYLLPGGEKVAGAEAAPGWGERLALLATDQWPVLLGYDPGWPASIDAALRAGAFAAVALALLALARLAVAPADPGRPARRVVLLFAAVNTAVALVALPQIPGNPRYILFLAIPVAVAMGALGTSRGGRLALGGALAFGALGSIAQLPAAADADAKWRDFAAELQAAGIRHCHTDFFIAAKLNFVSGGALTCSSKLGPTTTEYFFEHRRAADAAPDAALIAVNATNAEKLERRLQRLGVAYRRLDAMKPVLFAFSRPVDPAELFPQQTFPLR